MDNNVQLCVRNNEINNLTNHLNKVIMNAVLDTPEVKIQNIKLIEGMFTPSEASDILHTILDKKINFHKIQMLKTTEGNEEDPCHRDSGRLEQLLAEKERLVEILREVRSSGKKLKIDAKIEIELVD